MNITLISNSRILNQQTMGFDCKIFLVFSILVAKMASLFAGKFRHNSDVIMGAMASQITSLTIVYSTVHSGAKKTSKLQVTGLCAGKSPAAGEFPTQMASNTQKNFTFHNVSMHRTIRYSFGLIFIVCRRINLIAIRWSILWYLLLKWWW